jgi:UDP-glucose 4-epimerase
LKRIAITGALGHIGSRFIHDLSAGHYSQVDLVCPPTIHRLGPLLRLPPGIPFRVRFADICQDELDSVIAGVDVVVHLAALTASSDLTLLNRVNVEGTTRLAEACLRNRCRLLFVSSTSVYASQDGKPFAGRLDENYLPYSPYAQSKWRAEQVLRQLAQEQGLQTTILRFGTVYGPSTGMRFHTAVNKFVWQACTAQPLTVWRSSLDQLRPYLHVEDAVRVLRFVIDQPQSPREIFDVATETSSVRQVVEILRRLLPDLVVEEIDSTLMNDQSFGVDCSPIRQLGFEFRGSLRTGIFETVTWLQSLCHARLQDALDTTK